MIFCIIGKSATGKDSIYKKILEKDKTINKILTYTTRPKRLDEKDGVQYIFVDEKFLSDNEDKIIEKRIYHTVYGDWYYATLNNFNNSSGKKYLIIGTLESYKNLCNFFGKKNVVPIYIEVDYDIRYKRAVCREKMKDENKLLEVKRRFLADEKDFSDENLNKLNITKKFVNNNIDNCVDEIYKYMMDKND